MDTLLILVAEAGIEVSPAFIDEGSRDDRSDDIRSAGRVADRSPAAGGAEAPIPALAASVSVSPAGIEPALSARKAVVLPLDDGDMKDSVK